jgi:hypothetical protein
VLFLAFLIYAYGDLAAAGLVDAFYNTALVLTLNPSIGLRVAAKR